jgi:hypothetical protein
MVEALIMSAAPCSSLGHTASALSPESASLFFKRRNLGLVGLEVPMDLAVDIALRASHDLALGQPTAVRRAT